MRLYTFYQLFRIIDRDTVETIHKTRIGHFTLDEGAHLDRGIVLAGIDFFNSIDDEFEVDIKKNIWNIKKVYVNRPAVKRWWGH